MNKFINSNLIKILHKGNTPLLVGNTNAIQQFVEKTGLASFATFAIETKNTSSSLRAFLKNNKDKYALVFLVDMTEEQIKDYSDMLSSMYLPHLACQMDKQTSDNFYLPSCSIGRLVEQQCGIHYLELFKPHTISPRYNKLVFDLSDTNVYFTEGNGYYPLNDLLYFSSAYVLAKECGFNVQLQLSVTDYRGNTIHIYGSISLPNFSDSEVIQATNGMPTSSFQVKNNSTGKISNHMIASRGVRHISVSLELLDDAEVI